MRLVALLFISFLVYFSGGIRVAQSVVDTRTGNFAESFIDVDFVDSGSALKLTRSYQSRVEYMGMFGKGWCSNFETKLTVLMPSVIRIAECGAGKEVMYKLDAANIGTEKARLIDRIIQMVRSMRPDLKDEYFVALAKEMRGNRYLVEAFAERLGVKQLPGVRNAYRDPWRNTLTFDGREYKRILLDRTETFDLAGKLTRIAYLGGEILTLNYDTRRLVRIESSMGGSILLSTDKKTGKITAARMSDYKAITYTYTAEERLSSTTAEQRTHYEWSLDGRLTRIIYANGNWKSIQYEKERNLVTQVSMSDGCIEDFKYYVGEAVNEERHYWSTSIQVCNGEIRNSEKHEYWQKLDQSGAPFLSATRSTDSITGKQSSVFFGEDGKAHSREREGRTIQIRYDHLSRRVRNLEASAFGERYKITVNTFQSACSKPSERHIIGVFDESGWHNDDRWQAFLYNNSRECLPIQVLVSDGRVLTLDHTRLRTAISEGRHDRTTVINHSSGNLQRPDHIRMPDATDIRFFYDPNGRFRNAEGISSQESKTALHELLDILPD